MSLKKLYMMLMAPSMVFLLLIVAASKLTGVEYNHFMKEPSYLGGLHPFTGIGSNVGVLAWTATAVISIFTWFLLKPYPEKRQTGLFLLYFALLTIWLMLDDLLLFHESILPGFGISEAVTVGVYGIAVLYGLYRWRNIILQKTPYLLLIAAFGGFALSVFIDHFYTITRALLGEERVMFEDGFKFVGIIHWLCYFGWISYSEVKETLIKP